MGDECELQGPLQPLAQCSFCAAMQELEVLLCSTNEAGCNTRSISVKQKGGTRAGACRERPLTHSVTMLLRAWASVYRHGRS